LRLTREVALARKGRHDTPRYRDERDHDHHHEDDRRHEHDRGEEDGDSPARQAAIIARRWLGSLAPTAELYARARQQWLALPGATVHPAAEVQLPARPPATAPNPDNGEGAL
jgi:hypothetical protein